MGQSDSQALRAQSPTPPRGCSDPSTTAPHNGGLESVQDGGPPTRVPASGSWARAQTPTLPPEHSQSTDCLSKPTARGHFRSAETIQSLDSSQQGHREGTFTKDVPHSRELCNSQHGTQDSAESRTLSEETAGKESTPSMVEEAPSPTELGLCCKQPLRAVNPLAMKTAGSAVTWHPQYQAAPVL